MVERDCIQCSETNDETGSSRVNTPHHPLQTAVCCKSQQRFFAAAVYYQPGRKLNSSRRISASWLRYHIQIGHCFCSLVQLCTAVMQGGCARKIDCCISCLKTRAAAAIANTTKPKQLSGIDRNFRLQKLSLWAPNPGND